jgi:hypothetical protein
MAKKPDFRVSSLAALLVACGGTVTEGAQDRSAGVESDSAADSLACTNASETGGWATGSLGARGGRLRVDLDVTPSASSEDALVGLAGAVPSTYSDLAAIARFTPDGTLDARDGSTYRAVEDVTYTAGQARHLRFWLDTTTHRYDLYDLVGSGQRTIASDFAFRTEQANAQGISAFGVKVDAGGSLGVCNVLVSDASCMTAGPYEGFINQAFSPQAGFVALSFDATPSTANLDAIVGVSQGPATSFDDVAAAVRFNPDGSMDARDGDTYRAMANRLTYSAGTTAHFVMLLDVPAHTYSVLRGIDLLAKDFAFRSSQASVASLGNLVLESDSDSGALSRCAVAVEPPRDAVYLHSLTASSGSALAPLPDGRLLSGAPDRTVVYDRAGLPAGSLPFTGPVAVDGAGHLYQTGVFSGTFDAGTGPMTSAGGVDAYLVEYDTDGSPIWSRRFGGQGDDTVSSPPIVNANGDVLFLLNGNALRLDAERNVAFDSVAVAPGATLAMDAAGSVFVSPQNPPVEQTLSIVKLDPMGAEVWTHTMPIVSGGVNIGGISADATGGVVFGGSMNGRFDLGGMELEGHGGENGSEGYIAKLDADGDAVYAHPTNFTYFEGIASYGPGNTAISGNQVNRYDGIVEAYGPSGNQLSVFGADPLIAPVPFSSIGPVVADTAGSLYFAFSVGPQGPGAYLAKVRAP